jgi:hypothetical protein
MHVLPSGQQQGLLLGDDPHGAANLAAAHAIDPDQNGDAVGAEQIDLGLAVTEHMDVGRIAFPCG